MERRVTFAALSVVLFAALTALLPAAGWAFSAPAPAYGRLPLQFAANRGQTDPQVRFLARARDSALFLTPTGAVFTLGRSGGKASTLRMTLMGGSAAAAVTGEGALPTRSNYFVGRDARQWRTNVTNYARVRCRGVYPGVDMVYYGTQQQLEYDFVVAPRHDPGQIRLAFDGALSVRVDAAGDLVAQTAAGPMRWHRPRVYQAVGGRRRPVQGGYSPQGDGSVKFSLGTYDKARPLVIDPTCVYSTFLGGSMDDGGVGVAADAAGSAYVAGYTGSADFPTVNTGVEVGYTGDIFVSKLTPDGSALVYSTYIGSRAGSGDAVDGIAVDKDGAVYVTGHTLSRDFPTTPGAFQAQRTGGGWNAFAVKLSADGARLEYSTFLGGKGPDLPHGIAVDGSGDAFIAGETQSPDFPATLPHADTRGHSWWTFLTRLNPQGTGLAYSLIFPEADRPALAVGRDGSAYLTGRAISRHLPTTPGAFQPAKDREYNACAFAAKFDPLGALVYCTYLGGIKIGDDESGMGIAVNDAGEACVAGDTVADDFPVVNASQPVKADAAGFNHDAFVTKLSADGRSLVFSTYLGGRGWEHARGVAVDARGDAWVTGSTTSPDFPVKDAFQPAYGGGYDMRGQSTPLNYVRSRDAFVTEFGPDGALLFSTFLGGSESDEGTAIAAGPSGHVYVTGATASENFPVYHAGQAVNRRHSRTSPYDENNNAFVVKIAAL